MFPVFRSGLSFLFLAATASPVLAGPYSPGQGGEDEAAFPDAGIAGFVGPAGEGVTATESNGNYVNPIFSGWATGYTLYDPSDVLGPYEMNGIGRPPQFGADFGDPTKALGVVAGDNFDIVSMGDMDANEIAAHLADPEANPLATLILTFDTPIANGEGTDFAAFENGFVSNYNTGAGSAAGQMFAELGYVEVSTNGVDYLRFPSEYLNYLESGPSSQAYLTQDVSNMYNLVGKHANAYGVSWGTPFDLEELAEEDLVLNGTVDLDEINYVKIVDIPGDGTFTDSNGNAIYDAWVTWGSGGLDFEALGVINQALSALPGDANEDGVVNLLDLSILATNFNSEADWSGGDFNGDNKVDLLDLSILATNFTSSTVPEPATAVLSLIGVAALRRRTHTL